MSNRSIELEATLRLALEALCTCGPQQKQAIAAIKEALAQPEQDTCKGCNGNGVVGNILDIDTCPFCKGSGIEAQPEQEPSYWLGYGLQAHTEKPFEGATPVYTTPYVATPQPQRTAAEGEDTRRAWVWLTDEEIDVAIKAAKKVDTGYAGWVRDQRKEYAKAIEAKLKEKNT